MRSAWDTPSSTSMSTSPGKWSLLQCLQHWSLTLEERVGHCVADAWASSSCERTVSSQVCACSIDFYNNNIPLLHLDGETTMWITTTSEQDCCQLNQRYETCYMDPPHNCNEQYISHELTWWDCPICGGLRKEKGWDQYAEESSMDHERRRWAGVGSHTFNLADDGFHVLWPSVMTLAY